jgi:hypothetical protein
MSHGAAIGFGSAKRLEPISPDRLTLSSMRKLRYADADKLLMT